jgi:hypothetical protein
MHQHVKAPGAGRFSRSLSKSGRVDFVNSFVEYSRALGSIMPEEYLSTVTKAY